MLRMGEKNDIERCKELIKPEHSNWIGLSNQSAIKRVLGNLKILCCMQRTSDKKIKKLKEENETLKNFTSSIFNDNIEKEFVPVKKIKDKIEEIKEDKENYYYDNFLEERDIEKTIEILKELLQNNIEDKL